MYTLQLPKQTIDTADTKAKKVLTEYQTKYGMVANVSANMANHGGMLETYYNGFNAFFSEGDLSPAECDLVMLTISRENNCSYCVAGHSVSGSFMTQLSPEAITAVRDGLPLTDQKLNALVNFTVAMVKNKGQVSQQEAEAFLSAGYSEKSMLSVVLAIALKTMSNFTNHLFHTEIDAMMAPFAWSGK